MLLLALCRDFSSHRDKNVITHSAVIAGLQPPAGTRVRTRDGRVGKTELPEKGGHAVVLFDDGDVEIVRASMLKVL